MLASLYRLATVASAAGLGQEVDDWEQVVAPVVDHCQAVPEIDASRLALIGVSFGGYLAPRAAAFEPRLGAVVTIDGLFDAHESVMNLLTPELEALLDAQDAAGFNAAMDAAMAHDSGLRWYIEHGLWCFRVPTPYDFYVAARPTHWKASPSR